MSDCFSIKHSKYISSFLLLFLLFSLSRSPFVCRHRHAVIVNEGYCKRRLVCLFGRLLSPPFCIKWQWGLDTSHTASLASRTSYLAASVAHSSEVKLSHKQQKKGANQREYISFRIRAWFLSVTQRPETEENIEKRGKQWLTGLTGERIFTKLDINCNALHLRQGTCKVS